MRSSENAQNATSEKSHARPSLIVARLTLMREEGRPTGIRYEDAMHAAKHGGDIDFEGRQVRAVSFEPKSGMFEAPSARLTLDLGDEYLVLLGYFSRGGEFIEEGREHPFEGAT
jgi:hypothetical protein